MSKLQSLLFTAVDQVPGDGATIQSYSGRAMYGRHCLAITGSKTECAELLSAALQEGFNVAHSHAFDCGEDEKEMRACQQEYTDYLEVLQVIFNHQQDSMGYDVVIYWPSIPYEAQEDNEDDVEG